MKRILLSLMTISLVAAVGVAATRAFFSDVERSEGNTFTSGGLDLKVDSTASYNGSAVSGSTWALKDLNPASDKFFNFIDIKPGDYGENTISLHVYDNDAWARLVIDGITDNDDTCTESELVVETGCIAAGDGELRENLRFWVWLDQGATPGFQGKDPTDPGEGNNILDYSEPTLIYPGDIDAVGEIWNLADGIALAAGTYGETGGLTLDGNLVASTTYYFGIGWDLPSSVGDEVQTDSFIADMAFEVEQYRNNPSPFPTP